MTDQPDIVSEIANLLSQIRSISHPAAADPTTRAELLTRKADLLARITADNANRWTASYDKPEPPTSQKPYATTPAATPDHSN